MYIKCETIDEMCNKLPLFNTSQVCNVLGILKYLVMTRVLCRGLPGLDMWNSCTIKQSLEKCI